jgi:hypothetical protein
MTNPTADHSPKTCTYFACTSKSKEPCPFLAKTAEFAATSMPSYLPGQTVALNFTFARRYVLIVEAEQQENGGWHYFDWKGRRFNDEDIDGIT